MAAQHKHTAGACRRRLVHKLAEREKGAHFSASRMLGASLSAPSSVHTLMEA